MKMSSKWMLVLLFCCGWVYSAPDVAQSVHLNVDYGGTAVLPCNGPAFDVEDAEVSWEVMGSDVAAITGGRVVVDDRYEGRVHFLSKSPTDWSLILDSVRLSDSDMYECIWRGRRTLSNVWLTVEHPQMDTVLEVDADGAAQILPCYLKLPRNQSPYELVVWWERDGQILIVKSDNLVNMVKEGIIDFYDPNTIDNFPIFLPQYKLSPGEYSCWYQTKKSGEAKPGIPGTIKVIVKETFYTTDSYTENSTEGWGSGWTWAPSEFTFEETTTNEMPIFLETVTPPIDVSTEFLPMEAYEETVTSYPDEDLPEDLEESKDWSDFPWVRTGIIGGVLLVTAAALCILGVLHKL